MNHANFDLAVFGMFAAIKILMIIMLVFTLSRILAELILRCNDYMCKLVIDKYQCRVWPTFS